MRDINQGVIMRLMDSIGGAIAFGSISFFVAIAVVLFCEMVFGGMIRMAINQRKARARMAFNYKRFHAPRGWRNGDRNLKKIKP